jgi:DNA helicase-2/ATP-dependent DNA helicase PcrA
MDYDIEQEKAIENGDGYSLVIAGAGTGKTTVLTSRINFLCEKGVDPSRILLCTFTNKAAKEMMSRIKNPEWSLKLIGGTFHSIACRHLYKGHKILKHMVNNEEVGLRMAGVIDEGDSIRIVKKLVKERKSDLSPQKLLKQYSFFRNSLEKVPFSDAMQTIINDYELAKHNSEVVDFDDLLIHFYNYLIAGDCIVNDIDYVLVDEFQDCNLLQIHILQELTRKCKSLFAVGDDAQSIYSFRGAYPKVLQEFQKYFDPVKIFFITNNYRSQPKVLALGNRIIDKSKEQIKKTLRSTKPEGRDVVFIKNPDLGVEADNIVKLLRNQKSVAVLFRARYLGARIENRLMHEGIPYVIRGGLRFFEQAHIKDMVSLITVMSNYKNLPAWNRILELVPGVGHVTSGKLVEIVVNLDNKKKIQGIEPPVKLYEYFRMIQHFIDLEPDIQTALSWYRDKFYTEYLKKNYDDYVDREKDIDFLIEVSSRYPGYQDFLRMAMLDEEAYGDAEDKSPVILSTIHSAKGLEWDRVIVSGVSDEYFPNKKAVAERKQDEELRLFYVAVTRAREELWVSQVGESAFLDSIRF